MSPLIRFKTPLHVFDDRVLSQNANVTLSQVLRHEVAAFDVAVYCAKIG